MTVFVSPLAIVLLVVTAASIIFFVIVVFIIANPYIVASLLLWFSLSSTFLVLKMCLETNACNFLLINMTMVMTLDEYTNKTNNITEKLVIYQRLVLWSKWTNSYSKSAKETRLNNLQWDFLSVFFVKFCCSTTVIATIKPFAESYWLFLQKAPS